jgi:cephalosporin hydroxylase
MSGFLHRYFLNNAKKRCFKWLHYFDIYERHLERFRGTSPVVLEIGVSGGGSVEMWKEYFGEGSRIVGVDINPDCKAHEQEGIEVFIGGQSDPATIEAVFAAYPRIDIVIDDGSHVMSDMIATFEMVYSRINPNGVYLLEDTYTCYKPKKGGGLKREGTFMEFAKDKIDELHATRVQSGIAATGFTRSTESICFYDSIIVFERRPQGHRQTLATHGM